MARFQAAAPNGLAVQQLEFLVRTAIFKPANQLVAFLLQAAADQIDAAYQPRPGSRRHLSKARMPSLRSSAFFIIIDTHTELHFLVQGVPMRFGACMELRIRE